MRPGIDAAQLIPTLLDTAEAFAETLGTPLVCFKEFRPEERHLVELLPQHGFIEAPSLPGCRLPIRWNRFEQYLGDMRASYRRQVLASLRVREESGLRFRWLDDFEAECPRLFALYGEVMDRAEFQLERLNLEFFSALNRHMGAGSKALIGEWRGKVVATGVLLRGERSLTFLLAGIDYERARDCDAYINLVTEIVAEAIRTGADSLELGQTAYGLKQRLGGIPTSRSLYLRHRRALPQALYRLAAPRLFPERTPPARHVFRDATLPHRHDAMDIESSALQRRPAS
jgi:hypothetical protein